MTSRDKRIIDIPNQSAKSLALILSVAQKRADIWPEKTSDPKLKDLAPEATCEADRLIDEARLYNEEQHLNKIMSRVAGGEFKLTERL